MFYILSLLLQAESSDCIPPPDCGAYCRVTYAGTRNYYNATDGDCYPVPSCLSSQSYDLATNCCISPNTVPEPPSAPPNTTASTNTTSASTNKPAECVHGVFQNTTCICEAGYYTSTYQDPNSSTVLLCDTQTPQNSTYSQGPNGELYLNSQQSDPALQVPLNPIYKLLILLCTLLLSCTLSCCLIKRAKKSAGLI